MVKKNNKPIYIIKGGNSLRGEVTIEGAKNATLPAIVAASLSENNTVLSNVPVELNDVKRMIELLKSMNVTVIQKNNTLTINGSKWLGGKLNGEIAGSIRHSLLLLGLSVAWKKDLNIPIPGGCKLGTRKHDMHIDALKKLGNYISEDKDIDLRYLKSANEVSINFYYPTFGGTLNTIFASVKKYGTIIRIHNAAINPEVQDVINMLNHMGADIIWESERTLLIKGVKCLTGVTHSIMPDRIIGATVIAATGITKGQVTISNFDEQLLENEIRTWRSAGLIIKQKGINLYINGDVPRLKGIDIETKAYPGFHTDIQPMHVILMTLAKGESKIKETILDGRFKYVDELIKMGANIKVFDGSFESVNGEIGKIAKIKGVRKLNGTTVTATDIRGGAAVALAGMVAKGTTIVDNIYQLERGYGNFVELFNSLGANINRIEE